MVPAPFKQSLSRRLTRALALCLPILGMAAPASSVYAEEKSGLYVGILGIGSFAEATDPKTTGLTSLKENNTDDPAAGVGFKLGYRFKELPLRTELELSHRFRFDLDLRDNLGGTRFIGYENNLNTTSLLGNVAVEMRHWESLIPYLGVTVGVSQNTSEVDRTVISDGTFNATTKKSTDLSLGVFGGITWAWTDTFGMDLGYRFINLGAVDFGSLEGGETIEYENYVSGEALLSFYANF